MPTSLLSLSSMDEIEKKTHQTKPKPTCFLGCFGFSKKEKMSSTRSDGNKKKTRLFSLKKSVTKTVPVDTTVSDKAEMNCKSRTSKSKLKWKFNRKSPSEVQSIAKVATDQVPRERPQETSNGPAQNINLENRKNLDHLGSLKNDTCQKRNSFRRKIDTIRTGFSQPDSPQVKPNRTTMVNPLAQSKVTLKKPRQENKAAIGKNFDPVVGMSIIIVTLIIMTLWGRLCAIVCTCAWLCFIPRFRSMVTLDDVKDNSSSGNPDLNSEEYKKKVVLEGLLERNHRVTL